MITEPETNTVFLSAILRRDKRFKDCAARLTDVLKKHDIPFYFLDYTKDIWCRDYMPIQVSEDEFVQFWYEPCYLKGFDELRTRPEKICRHLALPFIRSSIKLEGGNLVNWKEKAMVSDRVFDENPCYSKTDIINVIKALFRLKELIIIPQIPSDLTGHIDGMIRFKNADTIVGNDRNSMPREWVEKVEKICAQYHLNYMDMPYYEYINKLHPDNAIGTYINYLEVGKLIVAPGFGNKEMDQAARESLNSIFPDRNIEMINFKNVALEGGVVNCLSWCTKEIEFNPAK